MKQRGFLEPTLASVERRWVWAGACLAVSLAGVQGAAAAHHVAPERIALTATWKAPQFVQADSAGRVLLLRSDTLEVYPVTRGGTLDTPSRLQRLGGDEQPFIKDAALSPDGGDWLLFDTGRGPRLFRGGKEQPIPELGWRPAAVALAGGQPLVAVFPVPTREIKLAVKADGRVVVDSKEPPPALVSLVGSEWKHLVREDYEFGSRDWHEADAKMRFMRGVRLAADPKGSVWVADEFGYRLRKFSPLGKLRSELTVGQGRPRITERSPADLEKKLVDVEKNTGQRVAPVSVRFAAARVVNGLTAARDGRVYLVVQAAGNAAGAHLAVDRFDPTALTLERVVIDGLDHIAGRLSVAAGRDALYVAAFSGESGGLYRLSWDLLDQTKWERVSDARLNGEALPPSN